MARIRFIKPEFFLDPDIGELSLAARLLFIGLWTQADREGRIEHDPRRLKALLFPYDPTIDIDPLIDELTSRDMLRVYLDRGEDGAGPGNVGASPGKVGASPGKVGASRIYSWVTKFSSHQRPHHKEAQSLIPPCPDQSGKRRTKVGASPGKVSASPSDSGFLILDSGVRTLDSPIARAPIHDASHKKHAHCGRVCLHAQLFGEFVRRRNHEGADKEIRDWALEIEREWGGDGPKARVETGDAFEFWRARYEERWPAAPEAGRKPKSRLPQWAQ